MVPDVSGGDHGASEDSVREKELHSGCKDAERTEGVRTTARDDSEEAGVETVNSLAMEGEKP